MGGAPSHPSLTPSRPLLQQRTRALGIPLPKSTHDREDESNDPMRLLLQTIQHRERREFLESTIALSKNSRALRLFAEVEFQSGDTIQHAGEPIAHIFVIREGSVSLRGPSVEGVPTAVHMRGLDGDLAHLIEIVQMNVGEIVRCYIQLPTHLLLP